MSSVPLKFPGKGMIKTEALEKQTIEPSQKVALIRKGNELYNAGSIEQAKRIFLTTSYTDGLVRIGDYYYKNQRYLQALQMYIVAPDQGKRERIVEKLSKVVQHWLAEDS